MIFKANFDFDHNEIGLPFYFGEKKLLWLNYKGFRCHTDIFRNPAVSTPLPPEEMKSEGYKIAYTISYPLAGKLPRVSFKNGSICYIFRQYKHYYIDTTIGFDNYLTRFKGKTVSTIRRKVKNVVNSCPSGTYFRVFSTPDEIKEFLPIAKEISDKSYQHRLLNQGIQYSDEYIADYNLRAKEGRILGFLLYAEDKPVAYNLCPIYEGGVMIYYYTGFDPDFNSYSPGTVLQFKTIETAFNLEQIKKYDLSTGEATHKKQFTDEFKYCGDIIYFPITPKYVLIVYTKLIYDLVMDAFKFILKRLNLTGKIKKWIRKKA